MSLTELTGNPRHDRLLMLIDERGYMNIDELASCWRSLPRRFAAIFVN
ncbi:DeoR family transcriptional regulator [Salmonella enterica subsp. enterica]|uniref:DeoR family transcriptional regulator n=1 Tax=Salmonella enterica I TaxID=59201 RepID=A0A379WIF5_SALET|nr:DeoR family transcriptional regulator [Salmonella enterica subsp. enterica]